MILTSISRYDTNGRNMSQITLIEPKYQDIIPLSMFNRFCMKIVSQWY